MSKTQFTIDTLEKALNVLQSYGNPITEPTSLTNVRVGNVSRINGKTGEPFTWDKSGEPYAIVNFKAITIDKMNEVKANLRELAGTLGKDDVSEEWGDAVRNINLTHNANYALADRLDDSGRANLHIDFVSSSDDEDIEVLRVIEARAKVLESHVAKNTNMDAVMADIFGEVEEKITD